MKSSASLVENAIKIDRHQVEEHLKTLVKGTVEDTLNQLLDGEAQQIAQASRYERSPGRKTTRAGHYARKLETPLGSVTLKMPKLRSLPFESAIIERYRRKMISVEEALMEMYLAGVSVRRVENITEALWGSKVSPGTISNLNKQLYEKIDAWRNQKLAPEYVYLYLDGIWLKRSWGGHYENVSVLVAFGVNLEGHREILGVCEGSKEDKDSWLRFLRHLKERGLQKVKLVISDKALGLVESLGEIFPQAKWQRCVVHFYRNVFGVTPRKHGREVAAMLKAIHAQEDRIAALAKARLVVKKLRKMKLQQAAALIETGIEETLTFMRFPRSHWTKIRTNNPMERINREVRRRTRVVGAFPDGRSALMLVAARLRFVSSTKWGTHRYLKIYRRPVMNAA